MNKKQFFYADLRGITAIEYVVVIKTIGAGAPSKNCFLVDCVPFPTVKK